MSGCNKESNFRSLILFLSSKHNSLQKKDELQEGLCITIEICNHEEIVAYSFRTGSTYLSRAPWLLSGYHSMFCSSSGTLS